MAKAKLFQLFDLNAGLVGGPIMIERHAGPAIRAFHHLLANSKDSTPGQYPDDFQLIHIGEQDDETGEITARPPEVVATGKAWREGQEGTAASGSQRAAPLRGSNNIRDRIRNMDDDAVRHYAERTVGPHDTGDGR